jgi:hypothetical protein
VVGDEAQPLPGARDHQTEQQEHEAGNADSQGDT